MKWTKEQQQVIDLRERNLLVSAAAGSGKTAVLVERIIKKITDWEHPVDIDRLLIVTFTNAAAAEMRERIGAAIEAALEKEPDSAHLQKQQTLLHNAQITTIHSFCLYVIRNYFHRIDLDPDFRVGEEGELKLLKSDVLDHVLEDYYEEADPEFLTLSETIATGKTDAPLKEAVLKLYEFAMSYPWVEQWLSDCQKPYEAETLEEFEKLPIAEELVCYIKEISAQWHSQIKCCRNLSMEADGPQMYTAMLETETEGLFQIAGCESYGQFYEAVRGFSFGRLAAARKYQGDVKKKEQVQNMRNEVKASMKKTVEKFFFQSPGQMAEELHKNQPIARMLIKVVTDFLHQFSQKKREKNMLDFNDLEHFALKILVDEETREPSKTAAELQKKYEEIMIDEYQDSNYVQETILNAVSGEGMGRQNIFMVGDVKQSIYRFRMARPELFMEKYSTYTLSDSEKQRIDLHMNFRSRPQVLETVNDVFYRIMKEDIGNITYDEKAALYPGAENQEGPEGMFDSRVLVVEPEEEGADKKDRELEAMAVGNEIKQMMENQLVTEKETGALRPVRYGDMVILLRSMTGWSDTFVKVLGEMGIPAKATTGTGYFSAVEVQTALNLLRVIDNPRQDIPMAAVLASPVAGLTGEELAMIRTGNPELKFYQAVMKYQEIERETGQEPREGEGCRNMQEPEEGEECRIVQEPEDREDCRNMQESGDEGGCRNVQEPGVGKRLPESTRTKLLEFLALLEKYRAKVSYTPIHELLYQLLEESGYLSYVYALPGGEGKRANLEMLVEKAVAYENTSYRGLFHFIRYMEQLQKYDVDFALAEGEQQENMVRIMSIHKSKGLEFPVVFVSGLGKMFNTQDIRERIVLHPQLGLGLDYLDVERRVRTPGLTRQFLARKVSLENTGEELRVLYVAMTRAKDRLVLTGTMKKASEKLRNLSQHTGEDGFLTFLSRMNSNTFLNFILPAMACYEEKYPVTIIRQTKLEETEQKDAVRQELNKIELLAALQQMKPVEENQAAKRLSYVYPYREEEGMRTKVSVSEIKHRAMDRILAEETAGVPAWNGQEKELEHYVPAFMEKILWEEESTEHGSREQVPEGTEHDSREQKPEGTEHDSREQKPEGTEQKNENIGARRGTAMHRILECYDFRKGADTLEGQLKKMLEEKLIEPELAELLNRRALEKFLKSPLAVRMGRAQEQGLLYREKPFVMGEPAKQVLEESESEEMVLIQGIIDVFFEEENEMVLLDYKTDRIKTGKELANRYRAQIELYQKAIERAVGKPVKEKLLYSFCLDETVELSDDSGIAANP